MNPHTHNEIGFAGLLPAGAHAQDGNCHPAAPAAPATMACPKCGGRAYPAKWHGQVHLRCASRQCGFHLPWELAEEDHGLADVKALPVAPADGLAGLRAV